LTPVLGPPEVPYAQETLPATKLAGTTIDEDAEFQEVEGGSDNGGLAT
jgi:hypothetical protein